MSELREKIAALFHERAAVHSVYGKLRVDDCDREFATRAIALMATERALPEEREPDFRINVARIPAGNLATGPHGFGAWQPLNDYGGLTTDMQHATARVYVDEDIGGVTDE